MTDQDSPSFDLEPPAPEKVKRPRAAKVSKEDPLDKFRAAIKRIPELHPNPINDEMIAQLRAIHTALKEV